MPKSITLIFAFAGLTAIGGTHPNVTFHEVQVTAYPLFRYPPYDLALASKMVEVIERQEPDYRFFDLITAERNLVPRIGILCLDLDKKSKALLSTKPRKSEGVIVAALSASVNLFGESFMPGDILYALNGENLENLRGLKKAVKNLDYGQVAAFQLERNGMLRYLIMELE